MSSVFVLSVVGDDCEELYVFDQFEDAKAKAEYSLGCRDLGWKTTEEDEYGQPTEIITRMTKKGFAWIANREVL
jgi:hypothetical protein